MGCAWMQCFGYPVSVVTNSMGDLVGLVFIDWLQLTLVQGVALGLNAAGWMWCFHSSRCWTIAGSAGMNSPLEGPVLSVSNGGVGGCSSSSVLLTAVLLLSGLWVAFWKTPTCVDQWLLVKQAQDLSSLDWHAFLEELAQRPYVDYQPPLFTFWVSRTPVLWFHQLLFFPWAMLCAGLMWQLYGRNAALLLATPVFALMIHQPSNDVLLFGTLLIVLRLRQLSCLEGKHPPTPLKGGIPTPTPSQADSGLTGNNTSLPLKGRWRRGCGYRLLAALIYGLTWMIKPLTLLTAPFILPQLGIAGFISLAMWGGYVGWSLQWEFGRHQLRFLLQQLLIKRMKHSQSQKTPRIPPPLTATLHKLLRRFRGSLGWRWKHLGHKAVRALPFYLFPAYFRPWTWRGIILVMVIILGYGNIKYLLLDLLFLLPVHEEIEYG